MHRKLDSGIALWYLAGGFTGFFLIHPVFMISTHLMISSHHSESWMSVVVSEAIGSFDFHMLPWSGAFAFLGSLVFGFYGVIRKKQQDLHEANVTKDKFFSILAHDLRNLFSILIGLSSLLLTNFEALNEKERKGYIQNIADASQQAYKLLEGLLSWSRIQIGRMELNPIDIDLGEIVFENIYLIKSRLEEKRIALNNSIPASVRVFADRNMIMTVFRNLIGNAAKFTPEGGEITISSQTTGSFEEITVFNTGSGIGPADIQKLFRIDVRFSNPGTDGEKGTGLGLILCKELVTRNGGDIRVKSEEGKGCGFTFSLPRASPVSVSGDENVELDIEYR